MRVIVAGGAGYIGSHVAARLRAGGYDPIIYDNMSQGHPWAVVGELVKGDVRDRALLATLVEEKRPCAIMHFASSILVGESMARPEKYYDNNVGASLTLLSVALEHGLPVIFSSSAAVYGTPEKTPITEDTRFRPESVYGETKAVVERALEWFSRLRGLRYVSLRYFNAAGASASGDLGEMHMPETHLIPLCLHAILGITQGVSVFGDDYPTPDGTCIRDYVHVDDLADAHILALEHLLNGGESRVYNLGCQRGYSVLEVIKTVQEITGRELRYEIAKRRPGDPPVLLASSERIKSELGWQPRYGLGDMVEHAWGFFRGNEGRVREFYGAVAGDRPRSL